jgi:hypothetical protein
VSDEREHASQCEHERPCDPEHVLRVRAGHGANCSSIGSVIDTLFATATVGAAVFAAIVAALQKEEVRVVGGAGRAVADAGSARTVGEKADPQERP